VANGPGVRRCESRPLAFGRARLPRRAEAAVPRPAVRCAAAPAGPLGRSSSCSARRNGLKIRTAVLADLRLGLDPLGAVRTLLVAVAPADARDEIHQERQR